MYRELPTQGILRRGWKQGADASATNLKVCFKGLSWFCVPIWSLGVFISPPEIPIFLPPPWKNPGDFNVHTWYTTENQIRKLRPSFDGSTNFIKQIRKTSSQQFLANANTTRYYFLGPIYLGLPRYADRGAYCWRANEPATRARLLVELILERILRPPPPPPKKRAKFGYFNFGLKLSS